MADVNNFISSALQEGHAIEDIVNFLGESEDPTEKAWADKWKATAAAPEYQAGYVAPKQETQGAPSTSLLEKIDQMTPGEVAAGAGAAYGLYKLPAMAQQREENKLARRRLNLEEQKLGLYAEQVAKQGMRATVPESPFAPELTGATEAPKLSPLEEARINTERARAEAIQAKIALEERKIALAEQKAKAAEEAKAAAASSQKTTASGAVNPEDRQMLQSSEKAKMDKAITAEQKVDQATSRAAQAAEALSPVQPPVASPVSPTAPVVAPVANQPVVPPKGPEITLTPSPEVTAEMQVVPKEATPRPAGSVPPKAKEQKTFKKIEELPKEMQFKAGVGGGDSWLHDTVGPDIRKFIIDEFNGGKPIGGGQAGMDKAYGLVGKYEQWLKENIPEQTLTRAERKAAGIPPAKQYGPLGKAVKVGGAAGLLMTATQAANAREALGNVAEALLPLGLTPGSLANAELTPEIRAAQDRQMKEMQKLGSPYRAVPPPKR